MIVDNRDAEHVSGGTGGRSAAVGQTILSPGCVIFRIGS